MENAFIRFIVVQYRDIVTPLFTALLVQDMSGRKVYSLGPATESALFLHFRLVFGSQRRSLLHERRKWVG